MDWVRLDLPSIRFIVQWDEASERPSNQVTRCSCEEYEEQGRSTDLLQLGCVWRI